MGEKVKLLMQQYGWVWVDEVLKMISSTLIRLACEEIFQSCTVCI